MNTVAVIGRGHSGTRMLCNMLQGNGYFMGPKLNSSADWQANGEMYDAARMVGERVRYKGNYQWDFSQVVRTATSAMFRRKVRHYLEPIMAHEGNRGWKLPETTLALPWLFEILPEVKYIFIVRDPRDCTIKPHGTDDIRRWKVSVSDTDADKWPYRESWAPQACSWKYHWDIVEASHIHHEHIHWVRYEDYVLNQEAELLKIGQYLDHHLKPVKVHAEGIGRWKNLPRAKNIPKFIESPMKYWGYPFDPRLLREV